MQSEDGFEVDVQNLDIFFIGQEQETKLFSIDLTTYTNKVDYAD